MVLDLSKGFLSAVAEELNRPQVAASKEDEAAQQRFLKEGAEKAEEQLGPFIGQGKSALSRLEKLFSGGFDVTQDPLFQAEERAVRSSLARLGLTQSGTGAGSAISHLVTGATQRHIGLQAPYLQNQISQGFSGAGAVSSLFSGLGSNLVQTSQFGQSLDFQNKQLRAQIDAAKAAEDDGSGFGALFGGVAGLAIPGVGPAVGAAIGGAFD